MKTAGAEGDTAAVAETEQEVEEVNTGGEAGDKGAVQAAEGSSDKQYNNMWEPGSPRFRGTP